VTSTRFSDHLRALAEPVWRAQHEHSFVRGLADGSLEVERFTRWLRQDYRFLIEYCRLFALAAARSPDLGTLTRFAQLLHSTAVDEMRLHRSYAEQFGISQPELEAEPLAEVTRAYTDFLLRTAALGELAELTAALLPCMWGYSEIGQRLARGPRPVDERYAAWIEAYADPEFAALADWCRELVDGLAEEAGQRTRQRMEEAFLVSSRYELAFWDV
jgi:thiaminase (transcriptional activator TenA)